MSNDGWVMTWATLVLTAVFELVSIDAVRKICQKKNGVLYAQGVASNFVNNASLARCIPARLQPMDVAAFLCWPRRDGPRHPRRPLHRLLQSHRWMHTRPMHKAPPTTANIYVVPVTANAVSLAEFAIAYMLLFVAGAACSARPHVHVHRCRHRLAQQPADPHAQAGGRVGGSCGSSSRPRPHRHHSGSRRTTPRPPSRSTASSPAFGKPAAGTPSRTTTRRSRRARQGRQGSSSTGSADSTILPRYLGMRLKSRMAEAIGRARPRQRG